MFPFLLLRRRTDLQSRNAKIEGHLRRDGEALPADWTEAAQVRENDEVLEHLDKNGRAELAAVEAALARIERGEFGRCGRCGAVIPEARVAAMPTASECMECCSE